MRKPATTYYKGMCPWVILLKSVLPLGQSHPVLVFAFYKYIFCFIIATLCYSSDKCSPKVCVLNI